MEDIIMLSALLRLIGKDGTNTLSPTNPLPVEIVGSAANWCVDNVIEAEGTAVNKVVTLTIPAVADKTIVLGSATAELFSNTARAAVGTIPPPKVSISNLGNPSSKFLPTSATTIGQLETIPLTFISPQKAAAVNTPVVITLPAYANCVGRLQATYTYV